MPTASYIEEIRLVNKINQIGNEFIPKVFAHLKNYKGVVFDFAHKKFTDEFNLYVLNVELESDEVIFRWSVDETYKNVLNFHILTDNSDYKRSPFIISMGYVSDNGLFKQCSKHTAKVLKNPQLKTDFDANFLKIHHPNNDENSLQYDFEDTITYHSAVVDFSSGIPKVYNHCNHFTDDELIYAATQDMKQNAEQILKSLEEKIQMHKNGIDFLQKTIPRIVNITKKE